MIPSKPSGSSNIYALLPKTSSSASANEKDKIKLAALASKRRQDEELRLAKEVVDKEMATKMKKEDEKRLKAKAKEDREKVQRENAKVIERDQLRLAIAAARREAEYNGQIFHEETFRTNWKTIQEEKSNFKKHINVADEIKPNKIHSFNSILESSVDAVFIDKLQLQILSAKRQAQEDGKPFNEEEYARKVIKDHQNKLRAEGKLAPYPNNPDDIVMIANAPKITPEKPTSTTVSSTSSSPSSASFATPPSSINTPAPSMPPSPNILIEYPLVSPPLIKPFPTTTAATATSPSVAVFNPFSFLPPKQKTSDVKPLVSATPSLPAAPSYHPVPVPVTPPASSRSSGNSAPDFAGSQPAMFSKSTDIDQSVTEAKAREKARAAMSAARAAAEAAGKPFSESDFVMELVLQKRRSYEAWKKAISEVVQLSAEEKLKLESMDTSRISSSSSMSMPMSPNFVSPSSSSHLDYSPSSDYSLSPSDTTPISELSERDLELKKERLRIRIQKALGVARNKLRGDGDESSEGDSPLLVTKSISDEDITLEVAVGLIDSINSAGELEGEEGEEEEGDTGAIDPSSADTTVPEDQQNTETEPVSTSRAAATVTKFRSKSYGSQAMASILSTPVRGDALLASSSALSALLATAPEDMLKKDRDRIKARSEKFKEKPELPQPDNPKSSRPTASFTDKTDDLSRAKALAAVIAALPVDEETLARDRERMAFIRRKTESTSTGEEFEARELELAAKLEADKVSALRARRKSELQNKYFSQFSNKAKATTGSVASRSKSVPRIAITRRNSFTMSTPPTTNKNNSVNSRNQGDESSPKRFTEKTELEFNKIRETYALKKSEVKQQHGKPSSRRSSFNTPSSTDNSIPTTPSFTQQVVQALRSKSAPRGGQRNDKEGDGSDPSSSSATKRQSMKTLSDWRTRSTSPETVSATATEAASADATASATASADASDDATATETATVSVSETPSVAATVSAISDRLDNYSSKSKSSENKQKDRLRVALNNAKMLAEVRNIPFDVETFITDWINSKSAAATTQPSTNNQIKVRPSAESKAESDKLKLARINAIAKATEDGVVWQEENFRNAFKNKAAATSSESTHKNKPPGSGAGSLAALLQQEQAELAQYLQTTDSRIASSNNSNNSNNSTENTSSTSSTTTASDNNKINDLKKSNVSKSPISYASSTRNCYHNY